MPSRSIKRRKAALSVTSSVLDVQNGHVPAEDPQPLNGKSDQQAEESPEIRDVSAAFAALEKEPLEPSQATSADLMRQQDAKSEPHVMDQLLELGKHSGTVAARISKAVQLMELPFSWREDAANLASNPHHTKYRKPWEQWLLNWVLGRLVSKEEGAQFRREPASWSLLTWLLWTQMKTLEPRRELLLAVEEALRDSLTSIYREDPSTEHETGQKTKKRKLEPVVKTATASPNTSLSADQVLEVFSGIANAISVVLEAIERADVSGPVSIYLAESRRMILRTSSEQAASIFGMYLQCLHLTDGLTVPIDRLLPTFKAVFHIWELRELQLVENEEQSSKCFASHCLVPAAIIVVELWEELRAQSADSVLHTLRLFVSRHIFKPARVDWSNTRQRKDSTSEDSQPTKLLNGLLLPLKNEMLSEQPRSKARQLVPGLLRSVGPLLEIAILSSQGDRWSGEVDSEWIQDALATLIELIIAPLLVDTTGKHYSLASAELTSLLRIAGHNNISLTENFVENLVLKYSNISNMDEHVDWPLISVALSLQAGIFTSTSPRPGNESTLGSEPTALSKLLFKQISRLNGGAPEQLLKEQEQLPGDINFDEEIIRPLMSQYALERNIRGFLDQWSEQLHAYIQAGGSKSQLNRPGTMLAHDAIGECLSAVLELHTTTEQVQDILNELNKDVYAVAYSTLRDINGKSYKSRAHADKRQSEADADARLLASLVVLEAVVQSLNQELIIDGILPQLEKLEAMLLSLAEGPYLLVEFWGTWLYRVLSRIYAVLYSTRDQERLKSFHDALWSSSGKSYDVIQGIKEDIRGQRYGSLCTPSECEFISESFAYAALTLAAVHHSPKDDHTDTKMSFVAGVIELLSSAVPKHLDAAIALSQPQDLDKVSFRELVLNILGTFVSHPELLWIITPEHTKQLFTTVIVHGFVERQHDMPLEGEMTQLSFAAIRNALFESAFTTGPALVRNVLVDMTIDCVSVLSEAFADELTSTSHEACIGFYEELSLSLHIPSISRKQKEKLLDGTVAPPCFESFGDYSDDANSDDDVYAKSDGSIDGTRLVRRLALMSGLLEKPPFTSEVYNDPMHLWKLAEAMPPDSTTSEAIALYERVLHQIFDHVFQSSFPGTTTSYLLGLPMLHSTETIKYSTDSIGKLKFWNMLFAASKRMNIPEDLHLSNFRESVMRELILKLDQYDRMAVQSSKPTRSYGKSQILPSAVLEMFSGCHSWLLERNDEFEMLSAVIFNLARSLCNGRLDCRHDTTLPVSVFEILPMLGSQVVLAEHAMYINILHGILSGRFSSTVSPRERRQAQTLLMSSINNLDSVSRYSFAVMVVNRMQDECTAEILEILSCAIEMLAPVHNRTAPMLTAEISSDAVGEMVGLLPTLCSRLTEAVSYRSFDMIMSCMDILIERKAWLVTQHGVDSVLSSLTIYLSSSGPGIALSWAASTYFSLCRITRSLVTHHRKKLRGRFHLLLPLLQSLLSALFMPYRVSDEHFKARQPWFHPGGHALGKENASAYSRILESICFPTVASVTTKNHEGNKGLDGVKKNLDGSKPNSVNAPHGTTAFTDETKAARHYAGQYVQYIVLEYLRCKLVAKIDATLQTAMLPGIYACLDVVQPETLKAMNASADSSMTAMFRELHADWRRARGRDRAGE